ncbi:MAG TPA: FAD-binding oxidoreductase [Tepidisphaeraceae bacterium]|nr:FAD-binding oxidoreductase [Tepidisphaeraceae bacterium]
MKRRGLLTQVAAAAVQPPLGTLLARRANAATDGVFRRVRPSDPAWPSAAQWDALSRNVGGRLSKVQSPLTNCQGTPDSAACRQVLGDLRNPYFIADQPGATQSTGWVDAWMSSPSAYAVAAANTADVVAAVNFARENRLRLVVKGGGHSYQGTSNAADSLLVWTRAMNEVVLHDAFVGRGCAESGRVAAVSIGAGAVWMPVYDAVTTKAGRYVQGGGCATVGVAGLILSGGFGNFSKRFGLAAAGLIEAEIVTADGIVRIVNACTHPDLFWALKGGGGGSLGVVTRVTLRTHDLPNWFGAAFMTIKANSDAAYRRLIREFIAVYREHLWHWGESVTFRRDNTLAVSMVSAGLDETEAKAAWQSLLDYVAAAPEDFGFSAPPRIVSIPARFWWDGGFFQKNLPEAIRSDVRPGALAGNFWWAGDQAQVGAFWHGYQSTWLPESLVSAEHADRLADALLAASRHWSVALHFNKGLAGAPAEALAAARDTAINPAALGAFALAIIAGHGPPAYPDLPGHSPDLQAARQSAGAIGRAMEELRKVVPRGGSYVAESNFFETGWQQSFWGSNSARLREVKQKYDPDGLFFVHHGIGSERWSDDGFTRRGSL